MKKLPSNYTKDYVASFAYRLMYKMPPGIFQCTIHMLLSMLKWQLALGILESILISRMTHQQHINHVCNVLLLLHNIEVTIKLNKRISFTDTIDSLGHVIRDSRLELVSHTANDIRKRKVQTVLPNGILF